MGSTHCGIPHKHPWWLLLFAGLPFLAVCLGPWCPQTLLGTKELSTHPCSSDPDLRKGCEIRQFSAAGGDWTRGILSQIVCSVTMGRSQIELELPSLLLEISFVLGDSMPWDQYSIPIHTPFCSLGGCAWARHLGACCGTWDRWACRPSLGCYVISKSILGTT